jgi:hypothetical protein
VQAAWLTGLGLPDNRMHNFALDDLQRDTPNKTDKRYGLLLVKNGSTFDCSSVGVTFGSFEPFVVDEFTEMGYDFLNGSHCGALVPRFEIAWVNGSESGVSVLGRSSATLGVAPQDPDHWTRTRSTVLLKSLPPIPDGATMTRVVLVFDAGTNGAQVDPPGSGSGLAILDNLHLKADERGGARHYVNQNQFFRLTR